MSDPLSDTPAGVVEGGSSPKVDATAQPAVDATSAAVEDVGVIERPLDEIFAGAKSGAKWFKATEIGDASDRIPQLGPRVEFLLAPIPNDAYQKRWDKLNAPYEKRGKQAPPEVRRQAIPTVYAATVWQGVRYLDGRAPMTLNGKPVQDTLQDREAVMRAYEPWFSDELYRHCSVIDVFAEEQEDALKNSSRS